MQGRAGLWFFVVESGNTLSYKMVASVLGACDVGVLFCAPRI